MNTILGLIAFAFLFAVPLADAESSVPSASAPVGLYFFWQEGCPLCARMKPFLEVLAAENPHLVIRAREVGRGIDSLRAFKNMADKFGIASPNVPAVFLGGRAWIGYNDQITEEIRAAAAVCAEVPCMDALEDPLPARAPADGAVVPGESGTIDAGFFGILDTGALPLVLSTLLIAILDGVNPCSLWVLTFLLGMVLHTGSRKRVLLVGAVFLSTTAAIYGLFILGVVQALSVLSLVPWIRYAVALFALAMGAVNVKDFFAFKQGISLTISDTHRRGFGEQLRKLIGPDRSVPVLAGSTVLLTAGIAIIELPCTAGFPIVWSNLVAAARPTTAVFTMLFILYLAVYLADELIIVGIAVLGFKRISMEEKTGRYLKLAGGLLMLLLSGVMVFRPALMESFGFVVVLFAAAGGLTLLLICIERRLSGRSAGWNKRSRG